MDGRGHPETWKSSMKIRIVKAEKSHLPSLTGNMRESDRLELYASMGGDLYSALKISYERSVACWCILADENPILIWGVAPMDSIMGKVGMPWMLGTPQMFGLEHYIGKKARRYIALMHYLFPSLINYVHGENFVAIRFLQWCGFHINPSPMKVGTELFYEARRTLCVG